MSHYRIIVAAASRSLAALVVGCLAFAGGAAGQQPARDFFDNTVIHDVHIDVSADDWAALKQNYLDDTYYQANVSSDSFAAYDVAIRSRGRGSRSPDKPNLDVNIDKYAKNQTFADLGFFILKANNQDPSAMHEMVAFELYLKMGLPAPREAPARLYVNGEYFGLYTIVEHEDEDFLDRNLGESGGDLFEWKPNANYNFQDLGDDPAPYANLLDPKTNEDSPDYQKFIDLVKAINDSPDSSFVTAVSQYLDLRLYLTLVATENAIAEIDGLWDSVYGTNNIYLYRFAGQDLFLFLPWDKDLTFWETQRPLPLGDGNVLATRLLAIPEYRTYYLSQLSKAADLMGGAGGWADQETARIYALIHDTAINDPFKQCIQLGGSSGPAPCGPGDFEGGAQDMRSFIAARAGMVRTWLAQQRYTPPTGGPTISSVSSGFSVGEVAPGALVSIQGVDFGDDTASGGSPLPRSAGRSFVAVEGVRAPIVSTSNSTTVVQIPWDLPMGTASVLVSNGGQFSNTISVPVAAASPDIVAVTHADGTLVTSDQPASAGEVVTVYATGLGAIDASIDTGNQTPRAPLTHTTDAPSVTIGAATASVLFAGMTPETVGLYQVNLTVPADLPSGGVASLTLSISGKNASIQIAVR